jgi:DNA-binding PadR family transcriptional regulator
MADRYHDAERFLPLSDLTLQVLVALGDAPPAHGYAIGKEIEERTRGRLNPTTGSLYQALRRLSEAGLIAESKPADPTGGADSRRKYFQLTSFGREVAALEVARLEELVSVARAKAIVPSTP